MATDSVMDERTLREIYLPAFETAVKEGGVRSLMTAYNRLNGTYCNENEHLLRDILRGEWGFDGLSRLRLGRQQRPRRRRARRIVAGKCLASQRRDRPAHRRGRTERVRSTRLFWTSRWITCWTLFLPRRKRSRAAASTCTAHHALAAKAAAESAVLLKNEKEFLPLRQGERVAVIGDFAAVPRYQGAGDSACQTPARQVDAPLDALRAAGVDVHRIRKGLFPQRSRCAAAAAPGKGARRAKR